MDEFIDILLREDRVFDIILPRLTKRFIHEENGELTKRVSLIEEDLEEGNNFWCYDDFVCQVYNVIAFEYNCGIQNRGTV